MLKSVLVCEEDERIAESICKTLGQGGYVCLALAKQQDSSYTLKDVGRTVEREKPDYIIVGFLRGEYEKAIKAAKKSNPRIKPIVFAGNPKIVKEAREKGFAAFLRRNALDDVLEYMDKN